MVIVIVIVIVGVVVFVMLLLFKLEDTFVVAVEGGIGCGRTSHIWAPISHNHMVTSHAGQVIVQILLGEWRKKTMWQEQLCVLQRSITEHHASLSWHYGRSHRRHY